MIKLLSIAILLSLFTACGDVYEDPNPDTLTTSGSTTTTTTTTTTASSISKFSVRQGIFIDASVEGLRYTTSSLTSSRYTDSQGLYFYNAGDTITFKLGVANLGNTVSSASIISPLTLFGTSNINDTEPTNMARFLQTLDSDSNVSNGISISSATDTLASAVGSVVDFSKSISVFGSGSDFNTSTNTILNGKTLLVSTVAQDNMTQSLNLDFNSTIVQNKTFTLLWDLGSQYSVYKFGASSVEIEEESRFIQGDANITSYSWEITTDGLLRIFDTTAGTTIETFSMLAITDTSTYITENSVKGLISMTSTSQAFVATDINGTSYNLLSANGDYVLLTFPSAGATAYGTYAEDANATLTWAVVGGKITTTGTVGTGTRSDSINPLVNQGDIYKINHDNNSSSLSKASFVKSDLPFFDAMVANTYHCITNKGLYYKLVLNNDNTGSITYQKESVVGIVAGSGSFSWSVNSTTNTLTMTAVRNPAGTGTLNLTAILKSFTHSIYLVTHSSGFDTSVAEHVLMYKAQANKTVTSFSGTYDIFWEDYNSATGEMISSRHSEDYAVVFDANATGYILKDDNVSQRSSFSWSINSSGQIVRNFSISATSLMTLMYDYRGQIKTTDNYVSAVTTEQYFMTLKKR